MASNENFNDSTNLVGFIYKNIKPILTITIVAAVISAIVSLFITNKFKSTEVLYPSNTSSISKALINSSNGMKGDLLEFGEEEQENGSSAPLRHAAPWFGVSRLTYEAQKIMLELNLQYSGEFSYDELPPSEQTKDFLYALDNEGNPHSPSWATLNLKANYQLDENWSISGGIENITDIRYRPYSSGIASAGRNIILAVRTSF